MRQEPLMPRIWSALRRLARSERGFSVPMTLMVVVAGLGLGSAAVIASINAQRGTTRDQASKDALAAADAGAQVALYRQNKVATTDTLRCVVPNPVTGALAASLPLSDGWCQTIQSSSADGLPAGTSFRYRVQPWLSVGDATSGFKRELQVVAVGTSNGISRRIDVVASAHSGTGVFAGTGAIGVDGVTLDGSAKIGTTTQNTHVATNGSIEVKSSAELCGNAYYGVGGTFTDTSSKPQCPGFTSSTNELNVPPVDPGDSWTNNSNSHICVEDIGTPTCSNTGGNAKVSWNPTTRALSLQGTNATLTLGGQLPYSFCTLEMGGGSKLLVAAGSAVTIYFDSPDSNRCNLSGDPVTQISMQGNPSIRTTSTNPGDLKILVVGSSTKATSISMGGNPSADSGNANTFTLYAPLSNVSISGSATYVGAVAAKTLNVTSATLIQDARATGAAISVVLNYARDRYVECTGGTMPTATGTHPNDSC